MVSPGHPCSNALWIPHNSLCTLYGLSDVIQEQIAAGDSTGIHCSRGFAIITPVSAINLKYPIVGALVPTVVVCSPCVIAALMLSQTHPICQADSPVAIHSMAFQSSGELTAFIDLGLDSDRKQEEPQREESLHVDLEAGSAAG